MSRISLDHPHHTLFIILALANANKDELLTKPDAIRRNKLIKNAPKEISQLDVVTTKTSINHFQSFNFILKIKKTPKHVKGYFSIELISILFLRSSRREAVLLIIKPPLVHTWVIIMKEIITGLNEIRLMLYATNSPDYCRLL